MLKNYFKIAIRNFLKQKGHAAINLIGLAVGMTCFIVIMLYVQQELNYDKFHEKANRIYRIEVRTEHTERTSLSAGTPYPVAPAFRIDYPEIDKVARIYFYGKALIKTAGKEIREENFTFADAEFLEVFSFPLLQGNSAVALSEPNSVVVTESMAAKYFGTSDPIGQSIEVDNKLTLSITGVVADPPVNSHFDFGFIASFDNVNKATVGFNPEQWGAFFGIYTYIVLPDGIGAADMTRKIEDFIARNAGTRPGRTRSIYLRPLADIHLSSHLSDEIAPGNTAANLSVITAIGFLILIIACINFMNLSTARATRRAREVGMRKVLGAVRRQLIQQFIGESLFLSLLALAISLGMVELMLPEFSKLFGTTLSFAYQENLLMLGATLLMALFVGLLSGIYPAFVLANFLPVASLSGRYKSTSSRKSLSLRGVLVVAQFAASILLIAATVIVRQQLTFVKEADLGFKKDLTVVVQLQDEAIVERAETIRQEFRRLAKVRAVTASLNAPIGEKEDSFETSLYPNGREGAGDFSIDMNFIDTDFIEDFGLEILAGRNFSVDFPTDKAGAIIINEAAQRAMGAPEPQDVIGRTVTLGLNRLEVPIIGVLKDFHIKSLHDEISPLVLMYWPRFFYSLSVKVAPEGIAGTLARLETTWNRLAPEFPFQYTFLDQYVRTLYEQEERTEQITGTFSALAIIIACLGLLGLAAFAAERRTKEIGIRKVLGASVPSVIYLLSREFTKWVAAANLIAWPVVWFAMNSWLQHFAYRIEIAWWVFLLAGAAALTIALLTVSTQAAKAALANPVTVLRYE